MCPLLNACPNGKPCQCCEAALWRHACLKGLKLANSFARFKVDVHISSQTFTWDHSPKQFICNLEGPFHTWVSNCGTPGLLINIICEKNKCLLLFADMFCNVWLCMDNQCTQIFKDQMVKIILTANNPFFLICCKHHPKKK